MHFPYATLLLAAAMTPLAVLAAQPTPTASPTAPGAATPTVIYESAFTGYRAYSDEKLAT